MSIKIVLILLGLSLAYTISPIVIALIASEVGYLSGCESSGVELECPGSPWLTSVVTTMTDGRVYAYFTIPTGVALSGILGLALIILVIYRVFR